MTYNTNRSRRQRNTRLMLTNVL